MDSIVFIWLISNHFMLVRKYKINGFNYSIIKMELGK